MIELRQINKTYHIKKRAYPALHNINLHIKRGDIFGIVGASGAGKSTLLRIINLLEKPSSGNVLIDGRDISALSRGALKKERHRIGMIFQHFNLLESRTAFDNIALPLKLQGKNNHFIQHRVNELLALVNLTSHANHYPAQLSGGQKQRVAIARALATHPTILLCDEPTSALDVNSTQAILSLLKTINKKLAVTIVLITHELSVIKRICDRAAILDHGMLIEENTVLNLFANPLSLITQQWVQAALHLELPPNVKQSHDVLGVSSCLVRFTFVGDDSDLPLMTTLVKQFGLTVNIIQANIDIIQETTVGFTVCRLQGDVNNIEAALAYVKQTSIKSEVLT